MNRFGLEGGGLSITAGGCEIELVSSEAMGVSVTDGVWKELGFLNGGKQLLANLR